jgi:hypothetical protein
MKIQRCVKCDEPTGKYEDDSLYIGDSGPYCDECCDVLNEEKAKRISLVHDLLNTVDRQETGHAELTMRGLLKRGRLGWEEFSFVRWYIYDFKEN